MFFPSNWMPCHQCGASVRRDTAHECDPEHRAAYEAFQLRTDLAGLESEIHTWLESTTGRFEAWLAAQTVREGSR